MRTAFGAAEVQASNLADTLIVKSLTHYRNNGASNEEKMQADFMIQRYNARIATRSDTKDTKKGTLVSVFLKSSDTK